MGIDATIKREDEGFMREWPSVLTMREDIKKMVDEKWGSYGL